ncbi:MAG: protein-glutamate O-methyltransferase CheR [Rhodospirillales bacterium]|nr:protein-glutamate O-methyltransferase CheR [Rhodospirillales bacterium]
MSFAAVRQTTTSAYEREFDFGDEDFVYLAGLARRYAGITISEQKRDMVYARLAKRLRVLGLTSFSAYRQYLDSPNGANEIVETVNALTTNLTRFFRESHHFDHLAQTTVPEWLERCKAKGSRRLRIWSAGCSTGEEPYSIAMTLCQEIKDIQRWDVKILATDIDTHVLAKAKAGLYSVGSASSIPEEMRRRFVQVKPGGRDMEMGNDLRAIIAFRHLNLIGPWPMRGQFDAIFCRNVVIYFDRAVQKQLFNRFADIMPQDGYLYIGHSESLHGVSDRFCLIGQSIHQKVR